MSRPIVEAQWTARERGRERFVCEQPPYSVITRRIEADLLPTCTRYGMAVIPYSPLAGGWLSGRYRKGAEVTDPASAARRRARQPLRHVAAGQPAQARCCRAARGACRRSGLALIQLAIAFVLSHPAITSVIIGPRTKEHLEAQLAAGDVELPDDVLDRIDEIVPPGVTLNPADGGWVSPALQPAARRR